MTETATTHQILLTASEDATLKRLMDASCERNPATALLNATRVLGHVLALAHTQSLYPHIYWNNPGDNFWLKPVALGDVAASFDSTRGDKLMHGYNISVPGRAFARSAQAIASDFNVQAKAPDALSHAVVLALNFGNLVASELLDGQHKHGRLVSCLQGDAGWSGPHQVFILPYDMTLNAKLDRLARRIKYTAQDRMAHLTGNKTTGLKVG